MPITSEPFYYHDANNFGFFSILHSYLPEPKFPNECQSLYEKLKFCRILPTEELEQYLYYRKFQKNYHLNQMHKVLAGVNPEKDTWITQAEFKKYNRRAVNLLRIGLAWVDLDYYNSEHANTSPEKLTEQILWFCRYYGYPEPSLVIYSGRGLQIKWLFTDFVPSMALIRWNALQKQLCDTFSQFGADYKAKDVSRVLRLVGTINSKSGEYCRVVFEKSDDSGKIKKYNFDKLCDVFLPLTREECRDATFDKIFYKKNSRKLVTFTTVQNIKQFNAQNLNWNRLGDLRTIAKLRGWNNGGADEGYQDWCLFLAICFLSWSLAPENLALEVKEIAKEFCPSWSLKDAQNATATAISRAKAAMNGEQIFFDGKKYDSRYRFKNETLINTLKITSDEQEKLITIISHEEAARREKIAISITRRNSGVVDRQAYLDNAEQKRIEARLRRDRGESIREIARAMGISVGSVSGYIQ